MDEIIYDEVYSIGCFDFFHKGHKTILNYMKKKGKLLIVGVHDDTSLEKLKNLKPSEHQSIKERVNNVKTIADIVYIIPNVDPTNCFKMIHNLDKTKSQIYIRANDNINFPGKKYVEKHMAIEYFQTKSTLNDNVVVCKINTWILHIECYL